MIGLFSVTCWYGFSIVSLGLNGPYDFALFMKGTFGALFGGSLISLGDFEASSSSDLNLAFN